MERALREDGRGDGKVMTTSFAALARRFPDLAARLSNVSTGSVQVSVARTGVPTAKLLVDGRPRALHSLHDPLNEARQFLDTAFPKSPTPILLAGAGLGWVPFAATESGRERGPLLVLEPDPALLRAGFESLDLAAAALDPLIFWFTDEPEAAWWNRLEPIIGLLADAEPAVVTLPSRASAVAPLLERFQRTLAEAIRRRTIQRHTDRKLGEHFVRNLIDNLARPRPAESIGDWRGRWSGRPALVVAAGPSLHDALPLVARAVGRVGVIAVSTALRALSAAGIEPDFAVQIDWSDLCVRHFTGVRPGARTRLVATVTASATALDAWSGPVLMLEDESAALAGAASKAGDRQAGAASAEPRQVRPGITVAHTAFHLAEFLGADPIILVGQDLAFPDGVYYAPGNGLHEYWRPELNRFTTIETRERLRQMRMKRHAVTVPGRRGDPVPADEQMLHYLRQFEADFAVSPARVLDASPAGAVKAGAEPLAAADLERLIDAASPAPNQAPSAPASEPSTRLSDTAMSLMEGGLIAPANDRGRAAETLRSGRTGGLDPELAEPRQRLRRRLASELRELATHLDSCGAALRRLTVDPSDPQASSWWQRVRKAESAIQRADPLPLDLLHRLDATANADRDDRLRLLAGMAEGPARQVEQLRVQLAWVERLRDGVRRLLELLEPPAA
jgi:hypothetical protein